MLECFKTFAQVLHDVSTGMNVFKISFSQTAAVGENSYRQDQLLVRSVIGEISYRRDQLLARSVIGKISYR